jgi:RNA polymerase sigma-70 factor (ECF subfamily)
VLVATLQRDLGDLGLAEDSAQEAFAEAATRWGPGTTPERPGAWLLTTARRKAIDQMRRDQRFADRLPALAQLGAVPPRQPSELVDDQLALIFGCCHASLGTDTQIALTLRQVCGLSTSQISTAFLVAPATMAKRLVRAKDKIRNANVPFAIPTAERLPDRLSAVLGVIYLIFTAGHTSSEGAGLVRGDLCDEARWLVGLVAQLLGSRPDQQGLAMAAPSPVIELNRAVAVAMADGPAAGLARLDQLASGGELDRYRYLHAARADLLRRQGRDNRGGRLPQSPRPRRQRRRADLSQEPVGRRHPTRLRPQRRRSPQEV